MKLISNFFFRKFIQRKTVLSWNGSEKTCQVFFSLIHFPKRSETFDVTEAQVRKILSLGTLESENWENQEKQLDFDPHNYPPNSYHYQYKECHVQNDYFVDDDDDYCHLSLLLGYKMFDESTLRKA